MSALDPSLPGAVGLPEFPPAYTPPTPARERGLPDKVQHTDRIQPGVS